MYFTIAQKRPELDKYFVFPPYTLTRVGKCLMEMAFSCGCEPVKMIVGGKTCNSYPVELWNAFFDRVKARELPEDLLSLLRDKKAPVGQIAFSVEDQLDALRSDILFLKREVANINRFMCLLRREFYGLKR